MSDLAWHEIISPMLEQRKVKPRNSGINMVIDTGLGLRSTRDILEISGHLIDHWKMGFGTSVFVSADLVRRKNRLLSEHGILTYPGGTLLEVALLEHHCRVYMRYATELEFKAVEISDGTIPLPAHRRERIIQCAQEAGLSVITEVGKKDPNDQPSAVQLAEQANQDIAWGADWVVVEGRETGISVGVYNADGDVQENAVSILRRTLGDNADKLIWEAPLKKQQSFFIETIGSNVSMGNLNPSQILSVEALRAGLRFETLNGVSDQLIQQGIWKPDEIEPENRISVKPLIRRRP